MTHDDHFIDQLEDYLDAFDGTTPLPEHVRGAVHAAIPATRQVRPVPIPLRAFQPRHADSPVPGWRLIAAVLVIAIGAGTILLSSNRLFGIAAAPLPLATATPSASAGESDAPASSEAELNNAQYRSCGRGGPPISCITAGTYRLGNELLRTTMTIDVPKGWFEWDPGTGTQGLLVDRPDAPQGTGWGVVFLSVGAVSRNPCDSSKGTFPTESTRSVDGLVAALSSWPAFQVSRPGSIAIGGAAGKQIAISYMQTAAECPEGMIWRTPQGTAVDAYPMVAERPNAYTAQFAILDVSGELLVIRTTDFPQTSPNEVKDGLPLDPGRHRADQQTLHQMLDSIRFGQRS